MLFAAAILIVFSLSFQVFPIALGLTRIDLKNNTVSVLILSLSQTVFFLLGYYAGEQFMYLLDNYKSTILFAGFFLIGIRMILEVLRIRKGERTFLITDKNGEVLAAMAHSMNTFLAALLLYFMPVNKLWLAIILFMASVVAAVGGIIAKPERLSFTFASFLYLLGGMLIIVSSLYFIFTAL
jgi:putative Mn2+ efflux pump MntP